MVGPEVIAAAGQANPTPPMVGASFECATAIVRLPTWTSDAGRPKLCHRITCR